VGTAHSWLHNQVTHHGWRPVAFDDAAGRAAPAFLRAGALVFALLMCLTSSLVAQGSEAKVPVQYKDLEDSAEVLFKSAADSMEWERARTSAARATGLRVVVSLRERRVWVMRGADTLRAAKAAVASGMTINFAGRSWTFRTPRGRHTVLRKVADPVWRPPDWLYAETAMAYNLELARLHPDKPVRVSDHERLAVRNGLVGLISDSTQRFAPLPTDEHIVFNDTLYIPPMMSQNRQVPGELGRFALDLGDGYLIHGTADPKSIGKAVTHGCIRLGDMDILWMYLNVPRGTAVHIY
jgi:hypothetical protein